MPRHRPAAATLWPLSRAQTYQERLETALASRALRAFAIGFCRSSFPASGISAGASRKPFRFARANYRKAMLTETAHQQCRQLACMCADGFFCAREARIIDNP